MASSSSHSDEHMAREDMSPHVSSSPAVKGKRKAAALGEPSKVSQRSSKKKKFQSLLSQVE